MILNCLSVILYILDFTPCFYVSWLAPCFPYLLLFPFLTRKSLQFNEKVIKLEGLSLIAKKTGKP